MGRGVASDGDYIYVGGIHIAENSSYSLLLKYDPEGHLMWSKEWRPGLDAKSSSIAVDDFGDVYMTGYVIISAYENRQFLLKYDKEGTLLYSMVIDSSGSETAWGISASDAVYICGEVTYNATIQGETARPLAAKMLLRKISLEGKMLWSRESSIGLDNVANSVDSEQEIIVVGYTLFAERYS